jgi:hypothetical protein
LAVWSDTHEPIGASPVLELWRARLLDGAATLAEALAGCNAVLSPVLLRPWARWITPAWSPRRYDTYFFLAAVTPGQVMGEGSGEAASLTWRAAGEALADVRAGRLLALTPTVEALAELADSSHLADLAPPARIRANTFSVDVDGDAADVYVNRPGGRTHMTTVPLSAPPHPHPHTHRGHA